MNPMKKYLFIFVLLLAATGANAQTRTCPRCHRTGYIYKPGTWRHPLNKVTCPACKGTGYMPGHEPAPKPPRTPDDEMAIQVTRWLQLNQVPVQTTCTICRGTGVCNVCKGSGYSYDSYGPMPCMMCKATKKCTTCGGNRVIQGWRQMTAAERQKYEAWMRNYLKRKAN